MASFARAYPQESFWLKVIFKPFWQMFAALFTLTWLIAKWMFLGTLAVYRWALPRAVAVGVIAARKISASRRLKEI